MYIRKRDALLLLVISIIIGMLLAIPLRAEDNLSVEITTPTESISSTEQIPTLPEEQEETLATKPSFIEEETNPEEEENVIDSSLVYLNKENKEEISIEVERCLQYIENLKNALETGALSEEDAKNEIERITAVLDAYNKDLLILAGTTINVPKSYNKKDFKSYEDYRKIKTKNTPHYKLQKQYAYTDEYGLRKVEDRYCIALGSYFTTEIGQYVDVVLKNGTIIHCILGDQKDDAHTDKLHIAHKSDGSIVEFIVDVKKLDEIPKLMGNISYVHPEWKSPVVQIIVYDKNVFDNK